MSALAIFNEQKGSWRIPCVSTSNRLPEVVAWTDPGDSAREAVLLSKLGPRGWGRIHEFMHHYGPGWGNGNRPLSPRALAALCGFLAGFSFPVGITPSVFLTDDGHLELCWEDSVGAAIQLEFGPERVEYYVESRGLEGAIRLADIGRLAGILDA